MLSYRVINGKKFENDYGVTFYVDVEVSVITNEFANPPDVVPVLDIFKIKVLPKKDKSGWNVFMPSPPYNKETKAKTYPFVRTKIKEDYENLISLLSKWADNN